MASKYDKKRQSKYARLTKSSIPKAQQGLQAPEPPAAPSGMDMASNTANYTAAGAQFGIAGAGLGLAYGLYDSFASKNDAEERLEDHRNQKSAFAERGNVSYDPGVQQRQFKNGGKANKGLIEIEKGEPVFDNNNRFVTEGTIPHSEGGNVIAVGEEYWVAPEQNDPKKREQLKKDSMLAQRGDKKADARLNKYKSKLQSKVPYGMTAALGGVVGNPPVDNTFYNEETGQIEQLPDSELYYNEETGALEPIPMDESIDQNSSEFKKAKIKAFNKFGVDIRELPEEEQRKFLNGEYSNKEAKPKETKEPKGRRKIADLLAPNRDLTKDDKSGMSQADKAARAQSIRSGIDYDDLNAEQKQYWKDQAIDNGKSDTLPEDRVVEKQPRNKKNVELKSLSNLANENQNEVVDLTGQDPDYLSMMGVNKGHQFREGYYKPMFNPEGMDKQQVMNELLSGDYDLQDGKLQPFMENQGISYKDEWLPELEKRGIRDLAGEGNTNAYTNFGPKNEAIVTPGYSGTLGQDDIPSIPQEEEAAIEEEIALEEEAAPSDERVKNKKNRGKFDVNDVLKRGHAIHNLLRSNSGVDPYNGTEMNLQRYQHFSNAPAQLVEARKANAVRRNNRRGMIGSRSQHVGRAAQDEVLMNEQRAQILNQDYQQAGQISNANVDIANKENMHNTQEMMRGRDATRKSQSVLRKYGDMASKEFADIAEMDQQRGFMEARNARQDQIQAGFLKMLAENGTEDYTLGSSNPYSEEAWNVMTWEQKQLQERIKELEANKAG